MRLPSLPCSFPLALAALVTAGCGTPKPPRIEDEARQMTPPPACLMRLDTRAANGTVRNLRERQYWSLVFPSFDPDKQALPDSAITCTGRTVFDNPAFKNTERTNAYPAPVSEGDILLGSGGDRLKVLWMRTHRTKDGLEVGPLALVRAKEDFAEVYAVGVYRGRNKRPLFGLDRIGYEVVVTVQDEGCTGPDYELGNPCESTMTAYLPRKGVLENLLVLTTERRAFITAGEPGAPGTIQYHLTASSRFGPTGTTVAEEMLATDEANRELRHAELERVFTLVDATLIPNEEPLWPRVFPSGPQTSFADESPGAKPPAKPKAVPPPPKAKAPPKPKPPEPKPPGG